MKLDKKQVFADIVYFDIQKRRGKIQTGDKLSAKVCQRFLYSLPTLVETLLVGDPL